MRRFLPFLLLSACSPQVDQPVEQGSSLYAGAGRDRLCIAGDRAGFIAYGPGDTNCSAKGKVERGEVRLTFIPTGDQDCRIEAATDGVSLRLGPRSETCAYYCGPGADYSGRAFTRQANASPAVDFAGDPLC